jgi:hypothetical protein
MLMAYKKKFIVENGLSKQTEASMPYKNCSSINRISLLMFFLDGIPTTVILRKDMKAFVTE